MRPLVEPNSSKEHTEIVDLLLANGIQYLERPSNFLAAASIWVEESDYERAVEIASSVDARLTRQAKTEWDQRFKGSYLRWFFANFDRPTYLFRLLLLLAMISLFVLMPIIYVVRN